MNKILFLLLLAILPSAYGQVINELKKVLPFEFIELNQDAVYSNEVSEKVKFDSSLSQKGDTTGIHNTLEYLMFQDEISDAKESEILKLLRVAWVSNQEYDQFCEWVLDSLYKEAFYEDENTYFSDDQINQLLSHDKFYKDINGQDSASFDPSKRLKNRKLYHFDYGFDWRKKLSYADYTPIINWFTIAPAERFYKRKAIDERQWFFRKSKLDQDSLLIARDREIWAKKSDHLFDYHYNLANHYYRDNSFKASPVQGILGNQAKAYLIYLELNYQKLIDAKKLPYRIQLTLPNQEDLSEAFPAYKEEAAQLEIKKVDLTNHWRITNRAYSGFLDAVRDSLIREALYSAEDPSGNIEIDYEIMAEMLKHPAIYYDEANMEWMEFDPSQPNVNRELFPFDSDFKWTKKFTPEQYLTLISQLFIVNGNLSDLKYDRFDKGQFEYLYYWQDLKRRANVGELIWNAHAGEYQPVNAHDINWSTRFKDFGNGIRKSVTYSYSIHYEVLNVYPGINCERCNDVCYNEHGDSYNTPKKEHLSKCNKCADDNESASNVDEYDFETNPEKLVQGLTYPQALAYYNWKFLNKTESVDFDEIIYDELLPSEAEFEKIQAGEQIIKASEKIIYPTPLFRYVVHVYNK
ncbi:MAG: hypothetical protein ACI8ZM_001339 [Crocinitomix sp.]|jgi:hypothetical protein